MINSILSSLQSGSWKVLDLEVSRNLDAFLCTLPWELSGHRLDWSKIVLKNKVIAYRSFELSENPGDIINCFNFLRGEVSIFFYSAKKESVVIQNSQIIENFEIFSCFGRAIYFFSDFFRLTPEQRNIRFLELDPTRHIAGTVD